MGSSSRWMPVGDCNCRHLGMQIVSKTVFFRRTAVMRQV